MVATKLFHTRGSRCANQLPKNGHTLLTQNRIIAIGDIHGCVHAFDTLLDAISPQQSDTIVILGDFIDKGRQSKEVIDRLILLQTQCNMIHLLGNHEEVLLNTLNDSSSLNYWMQCGGVSTLNSYRFGGSLKDIPEEHLDFIRSGVNYFETENHLFAHACPDHDLPLSENSTYALRWQLLEPDEVQPHDSGKTVIVGHTEQISGEILDLGFIQCIDTACWRYGWLTALEVTSGEVWQAQRFGMLRELGDTPVGPIGDRNDHEQ